MFSAAMRVLQIKDLKDLSVFFGRGFYRHAGPKGPEKVFSRERSRGTGPRATVKRSVPITVGRGPVPRHASIGGGNGFGCRAFFARVERSRGTGPRATGQERDSPRHAPVRDQAIPNYSHWSTRTSAGDRPPRYGLILLIVIILQILLISCSHF